MLCQGWQHIDQCLRGSARDAFQQGNTKLWPQCLQRLYGLILFISVLSSEDKPSLLAPSSADVSIQDMGSLASRAHCRPVRGKVLAGPREGRVEGCSPSLLHPRCLIPFGGTELDSRTSFTKPGAQQRISVLLTEALLHLRWNNMGAVLGFAEHLAPMALPT